MSWIARLRNALNPRRLDEDLAEEFRDHLERRTSALQSEGLSRTEAQRRAAVAFGNAAVFREQSREQKLWAAAEATLQDARHAARGLLRKPVFAFTAVVSLSLAIGANTAIFSIVDAVLLRPLPVPKPDRLVALATTAARPSAGLPLSDDGAGFSYPLYEQLRLAAGPSARLALFDSPNRVEAQTTAADAPREEVVAQFVSPDAFDILGVPPALGRLFSMREDRFPAPRAVVVLSHDYWRRRFGGDPAVPGRSLIVSGRTYSILGVAREGFSGDEPGRFVDVWLPVTLSDPGIFANPEFRPFHLLGRLAPRATREQLAARLAPVFHRHQLSRLTGGPALPLAMQEQLRETTILVSAGSSGSSSFRRNFSRPLWVLAGVAACILLIACANLASLLLARSAARAGEMALRVSLGAGRSRLLRQLLTESLLISCLAGLGGWLLARVAAPALVGMVSRQGDPLRLDLATDTRILLFCLAICVLSALFFGALPAWAAANPRPMLALRHVNGQAGRLRAGRFFVGVQVAFAFCLVAGGAGFLFSLHNLGVVDTGFDPKGVTVLTMTDDAGQRDRQLALMQQLQLRAAALPHVQSAAAAWLPIFSGSRRAQRVILPGQQPSEREETFYRVAPGYFATLRTPLLSGRDLTFQDNDNEPVPSIVNRAFARRYFRSESVLGRQFQRDDGVRHQVVGMAADSRYASLRGGPEPIVYMPMKPPRAFTLYIRSTLDAASVVKMVEREATALGSGMRLRDAITLNALVGSTILQEKLLAAVSGAMAFLGLTLAAVGLFGLLNYSVERRTKEIGIRAALGAGRLPIYLLVLKDLTGMVAAGMVVGLTGSVALLRFARSLLFEVQPADPIVIGTAIAAFLAVAWIAGGLP
ncbi:MAG: ABC transporter permease, partial [Acidobacteriota bacterium]